MIKAVIFDMDGVLVEAKDWHYEALNKALTLFGYEINRVDHLTNYDGLPTKRKLDMLTVERGLPIALHEFINELKQLYTMEMVYVLCKPKFKHQYALSNLKASGYKLGLASNSIKSTVEMVVDKTFLKEYLEITLSNEDVNKPKPDPEIYIKAMKLLGVNPLETLIVEDNENGIRAAKASGAHVLVVRDVEDVSLKNILIKINQINEANQ